MTKLTTHVLDVYSGKPGKGIKVDLFFINGEKKEKINSLILNNDGRTDKPLAEKDKFKSGKYELVFYIGEYFKKVVGNNELPFIDDVVVGETLSTNESEILDMVIYPNPVEGNFVTIQSPVDGSKDVQVYTVTGRKVIDTTINGNTLDVSSLNSGFYMINVTINGQSKISKLVVR